MAGLREHVAKAIESDQSVGGVGILTTEEVAALEYAMALVLQHRLTLRHDEADEAEGNAARLGLILHDLGHGRMFVDGAIRRIDQYHLHCADVAIAAYDGWVAERASVLGKGAG